MENKNFKTLIKEIEVTLLSVEDYADGREDQVPYYNLLSAFQQLEKEYDRPVNRTKENNELLESYLNILWQLLEDSFGRLNREPLYTTKETSRQEREESRDYNYHVMIGQIENVVGDYDPRINLNIWDKVENRKTEKRYSVRETSKPEITVVRYAIFHYYKQEAKCETRFDCMGITKMQAMQKTIKPYKISVNSFNNSWYLVSSNDLFRTSHKNRFNLRKVITMLQEFPNAQKLAEADLEIAELKND